MTPPISRAETLLRRAASAGAVARGVLEVVRVLERREAVVVFLAHDLTRPELKVDVQRLAGRASTPVIERYGRAQLGAWSGIQRGASMVALHGNLDARVLAEELEESAPALLGTFAGLQLLLRHHGASPVDLPSGALAGLQQAAAQLTAGEDPSRALGALLRCTFLLAQEREVDLAKLVTGWSLASWVGGTGAP